MGFGALIGASYILFGEYVVKGNYEAFITLQFPKIALIMFIIIISVFLTFSEQGYIRP